MHPPATVTDLLQRAQQLAGFTLAQVASQHSYSLPKNLLHAKGCVGQLLETCLGAHAGSLPMPDFPQLGVELKTIPVDSSGKPHESTYICTVPLTAVPGQTWETSLVWRKLQAVLWIPILASPHLSLAQRQIGMPFLWRPSAEEASIVRNDWEEAMALISEGRVAEITAKQGAYLQIRPKAANSRALTTGIDPEGSSMATLPRGFYLRSRFTQLLLARHFN